MANTVRDTIKAITYSHLKYKNSLCFGLVISYRYFPLYNIFKYFSCKQIYIIDCYVTNYLLNITLPTTSKPKIIKIKLTMHTTASYRCICAKAVVVAKVSSIHKPTILQMNPKPSKA